MERSVSSPEVFARELMSQLDLRRVGKLSDLTSRLGLSVKEVDSDDFEGVLICREDRSKGIIAVRRTIREEGRKRFAICHEIGHYILPGHGARQCICKTDDIESWRKSMPEQELAANRLPRNCCCHTGK